MYIYGYILQLKGVFSILVQLRAVLFSSNIYTHRLSTTVE